MKTTLVVSAAVLLGLFLCPCDPSGAIPWVDDAHAERFLDTFAGFRVLRT